MEFYNKEAKCKTLQNFQMIIHNIQIIKKVCINEKLKIHFMKFNT